MLNSAHLIGTRNELIQYSIRDAREIHRKFTENFTLFFKVWHPRCVSTTV